MQKRTDHLELRQARDEVDGWWPFRLEAEVGLAVLSLRYFLLGVRTPPPQASAMESVE
jgi:hypothetical protein